jgi:hypothetical protein
MNCDLQCPGGRPSKNGQERGPARGAASWLSTTQVNGIVIAGKTLNRTEVRVPGAGYAVLRGTRIQIRGNRRDVMRKYPGRNLAASRVTGFGDFLHGSLWDGRGATTICGGIQFQIQNATRMRSRTGRSAWVRLGPDKIFFPRTKLAEESPSRFKALLDGYPTGSGCSRTGLSIRNAKGKS